MASSTTKTIANVVKQAQVKYNELMESPYISASIRIDGVETRGQSKDADSVYSTQDKNSKLMTCMLDINVLRGSFVEQKDNESDTIYKYKGIVTSIPTKTPVDYYFTVLMFNADARRERQQPQYDEYGDIIADSPLIIDEIPCYVERVSARDRQLDAGIEKNIVNKIITLKTWDIAKNDVIYVGSNSYRVTDIEELEKDMLIAYMTYFRE